MIILAGLARPVASARAFVTSVSVKVVTSTLDEMFFPWRPRWSPEVALTSISTRYKYR